jgi:hypothetical protein
VKRLRVFLERSLPRLLQASQAVIALMLIFLVFSLGVLLERSGFVRDVLDPGLKRISRPVLNAFRGRPPAVPLIAIEMDAMELDSLDQLKRRAKQEGWTDIDLTARFAVDLILGDQRLPGVIGLLEGPTSRSDEWSYHIRLLPGDTLFGMRTFEAVPMIDGSGLKEWCLDHILDGSGHPTSGAALVELALGPGHPALYLLRGDLETTRINSWGMGNGPVLRFGDELAVNAMQDVPGSERVFPPLPQSDWMVAPIILGRPELLRSASPYSKRAAKAVVALEKFRSGERNASEIFDVQSTARLLALADLLGAQEAMRWPNLRFMVDSVSGLLHVLPLRGEAFVAIPDLLCLRERAASMNSPDIVSKILADPTMFSAYIACLDSLSGVKWIDGELNAWMPKILEQERIVVAEHPSAHLDRTLIRHHRDIIRRMLHPRDLALAYAKTTRVDGLDLAVANVHALPIQIIGSVSGQDTLPVVGEVILQPREPDRPLLYVILRFRGNLADNSEPQMLVRIPGTQAMRNVKVRSWNILDAQ